MALHLCTARYAAIMVCMPIICAVGVTVFPVVHMHSCFRTLCYIAYAMAVLSALCTAFNSTIAVAALSVLLAAFNFSIAGAALSVLRAAFIYTITFAALSVLRTAFIYTIVGAALSVPWAVFIYTIAGAALSILQTDWAHTGKGIHVRRIIDFHRTFIHCINGGNTA